MYFNDIINVYRINKFKKLITSHIMSKLINRVKSTIYSTEKLKT